jgi:hypothetical protein
MRVVARRSLIVLVLVIVAAALTMDIVHRWNGIGVDFHTYLAAAHVGLQQGWTHIYDQHIVAQEQKRLVSHLWAQPFLSPPTVAWLAALLAALPYDTAYAAWAVFMFAAFACALAWAGISRGLGRWIAVAGALAPWWVMLAVNVGQVVPLVAASTVVAWRLLRDKRDVAAGVVLAAMMLKPNTVALVPIALLFAGRQRAFVAWLAAVSGLGLIGLLLLGPHGSVAYLTQLLGPLPRGADALTLHGAFGVTGATAALLRVLLLTAVLGAAYRLRGEVELVIPIAIVGSLLIAPYLHASDLCVLSAAGWMVWEARTTAARRVPLAVMWVLGSPYLFFGGVAPSLIRWPIFELILLAAIASAAWRPLTAWADLRSRAPA